MPPKPGSLVHRLVLLLTLSVLGGVVAAAAALPLVGGVGLLARNAANSFNQLPSVLRTPPLGQRSTLLAADGSVIATLYGAQNRVTVPVAEIPIVMRQALVAIEDSRFYQHPALDVRGILRAALRNFESGGIAQGGSTLTQQYVKNVLIQTEGVAAATADTLSRKIQEARYAIALERTLTKEQILGRYLNIAYFGEGVYGVATAAQHYFREPVGRLTLPQSALLAGLVEDPTGFDPVYYPRAALARRDTVLARMAQLHYVSAAAAAAAAASPLGVHPAPPPAADPCSGSSAPFFCSYVLNSLLADPALGSTPAARANAVFEGGLTITTTLNPRVEAAAQSAVDALVPQNNRAVTPIAMVEPGSGDVLALTMNRTYGAVAGTTDTKLPLVTEPFTMPGSAFKLFTLVAALENGISPHLSLFAPSCYVSKVFTDPTNGPPGCPTGFHNAGVGESGRFSLPRATWDSVNTYFIQLEERVGLPAVISAAQSLGLPHDLFYSHTGALEVGGSLTLGGLPHGVSVLDMALAYAAIAAEGKFCPARFIVSITGPGGKAVPFTSPGNCTQAVPPGVANTITSILQGVITQPGATGYPNANIGRPAAGKTGTNGYTSAWFVGYTPQLAAAVAMADPRGVGPAYNLQNYCVPSGCFSVVYGGTLPAEIWARAMSTALANQPVQNFPSPPTPATPSASPSPSSVVVSVPDVVGMTVSQATAALSAAGLTASISGSVPSATIPVGDVAASQPAAGTPVPAGTTVTLALSTGGGPAPSPAPPSSPTGPLPGGQSPSPPAQPPSPTRTPKK